MTRKIFIALSIVIMTTPAFAHSVLPTKRHGPYTPDLQFFIDLKGALAFENYMFEVRGNGPTLKASGQYRIEPHVVFKTDYRDVNTGTVAGFAIDLHNHLVDAGYDYNTWKKNHQFMPYSKLDELAREWWTFKGMKPEIADSADARYEALVDAVNVYPVYASRRSGEQELDYIQYEDANLKHVLDKAE